MASIDLPLHTRSSALAPFFSLLKTKGKARAGVISTPHGQVETPIFMPVGTLASVKALDSSDIEGTAAQIILANTYHLYLRPGVDTLTSMGGVHHLMNWSGPVLTDSGGFQVFSLGKENGKKNLGGQRSENQNLASQNNVKISDDGVEFSSHLDGSKHQFTPKSAIEIQRQIGADIIMAFDECSPDQASHEYATKVMDRTHRWAKECQDYWQSQHRLSHYGQYQALFGIIQGAMHPDLRLASAEFITGLDFDGIAVGGETIGYNMDGTIKVMSLIEHILPTTKPRYAMGLGRDPQDLIDAVLLGFDMFDCVGPTRLARNGAVYFGQCETDPSKGVKFVSPFKNGRLNISNSQFATDPAVIQPGCDCYTCQSGYSRAYLHHLLRAKELSYYRLASIHNVRFMIRLSEELRKFVLE